MTAMKPTLSPIGWNVLLSAVPPLDREPKEASFMMLDD
jgi:hypothetical protein